MLMMASVQTVNAQKMTVSLTDGRSRSLSDSYSDCGCYLYIQSGTFFTHGSDRYRGQSIRPVRKR